MARQRQGEGAHTGEVQGVIGFLLVASRRRWWKLHAEQLAYRRTSLFNDTCDFADRWRYGHHAHASIDQLPLGPHRPQSLLFLIAHTICEPQSDATVLRKRSFGSLSLARTGQASQPIARGISIGQTPHPTFRRSFHAFFFFCPPFVVVATFGMERKTGKAVQSGWKQRERSAWI